MVFTLLSIGMSLIHHSYKNEEQAEKVRRVLPLVIESRWRSFLLSQLYAQISGFYIEILSALSEQQRCLTSHSVGDDGVQWAQLSVPLKLSKTQGQVHFYAYSLGWAHYIMSII